MATKRKSSDAQDSYASKRSCNITKERSENGTSGKHSKKSPESWGIIESISLRNFMCHSRLTMRFSNNVNFIVGHNGSGKSAVLTGIIVGLGGKAASTSRGTSLKTLIKTGANSAVVELTLRNNGDDQVKPEVYGNKIIIERRITIDGASAYKIKNSSGKVVSTKKDDLLSILDEINLHVDNPLTCLNQEMSKNFLHSKNESDKYKFFLKATQLEQMNKDYRYIKEQRIVMHQVLDQKEKVIPELEKDVLEKEQKFKDLATLQELKNKVETLKCELAWSHVAHLEHSVRPLKKELEREGMRTPKYDAALKECARKEAATQKKFDELQKRVKEYQKEVKVMEPEKKDAKVAHDRAKVEFKSNENALNRAKRQLRETHKDRSDMEMRIQELKTSAKTNVEEMKKKREEELACLNDRANGLQAQLKTTTHQTEQFAYAIRQGKEKYNSMLQENRDLEQRQGKLKQVISSLTSSVGRKNKLQLFGAKMPEFVRRIEEAYGRRKFRQKPRGPIGSCVSLKDQSMAVAVECAIKGFIHSFVVDNHQDEKVLEQLRNSVFHEHERSRIVIYTARFADRVYDVSRGSTCHPVYRSVLDLLTIDDPVVANFLIDLARVESILVIPKTQDALKVIQQGAPPRNCLRAYTEAGDEVLPDRYYSNPGEPLSRYLKADVEGEVARNRQQLHLVEERLKEARVEMGRASGELKRNEQEQRRHERMKTSIMEQIKNIRIETRALEATEDQQTFDVRDLEDEVLNFSQQIVEIEKVVEEQTQNMERSSQLARTSKVACDEIFKKMKEIAECAEDLTEKINLASREVEKIKSDRVHFNEGKKKHLEVIEKTKKEIEAKQKQIVEETEKASLISKEKIVTRRTPNNLENEIKQIYKRINYEEAQHGDHESIVREYHEVREKFSEIKRRIRWSRKFLKQVDVYLAQRNEAYEKMRTLIAMRCSLDFNVLLDQRGYTGSMQFDHQQKLLLISVQPHDAASQSTDLRVLSGGERSFSTVCYILALWQVIESPLRCLDEFDVFMDMANRRVAMDMMVEIAMSQKHKQFIFLTPHDISALPKSSRLHVWKMADPDRNQSHLPFQPV